MYKYNNWPSNIEKQGLQEWKYEFHLGVWIWIPNNVLPSAMKALESPQDPIVCDQLMRFEGVQELKKIQWDGGVEKLI